MTTPDEVQFCTYCAEPFPAEDPMLDYDQGIYCSPDCVREMLANEDRCDHTAWVAAVQQFRHRVGVILGGDAEIDMEAIGQGLDRGSAEDLPFAQNETTPARMQTDASECVGIPLPPIRDEVGPGVAEALRADVLRHLAWTEADDV